ncbi:DMT family transporter [Amycolatopsis sp. H20-H5]|uniref:DMT family transporter n=1 Tax=Amycolatopsis sp. H20-H5 TaxID=3046309 RepID=UPI002DBA8CE1|nr:DMT family transporter [Amycolatopsis sp. H20-H5]MEC3978265.1 DMT family transporter [Amycolatopsis sp. H20-H5]
MSLVLYGFVVLVWGLTWIAIKYQLGEVPMAASICYRSLGAALLLLGYVAIRKLPMRFGPRDHLRMALIGTLMFSVNYLFLYAAEQHIPSGLVALVFAMTLPLNVVNSAIFLGRRVQRTVLVGGVVGLSGMAMVFWVDLAGFSLTNTTTLGVIEAFCAALCFSLGNIVSDRTQEAGVPIVQSEAYGLLYGSLILAVVAAFNGGFAFDTGLPYVAALTYLIVFGSIVGFGLYLSIIGRIGAQRAGYVTVLFPIVALLVSTFVEGYSWTGYALAGAVLIVVGNALVNTRPETLRRLLFRGGAPEPSPDVEDRLVDQGSGSGTVR